MARARNMQSLTEAVKRKYPGVVVYGIGDEPHKLSTSDHNEDDTPGSKAAQSDADSNPEHRAIDIMLGPAFSRTQAYQLINDLLADSSARARLYYIIFDGWIWSRSTGWSKRAFDGDPHRDHPHISGWAADDENAAGWPAVESGGGGTDVWCRYNEKSLNVRYVQFRLKNLGFYKGEVDDHFGPATAAALKAACLKQYPKYNGDGKAYDPDEAIYLDVLWAQKYGPAPQPGPKGEDGKDGRDGILVFPEVVTIQAQIQPPSAA